MQSPPKQLRIMYGMRPYRTLIKRVLMYGCETRKMNEAMLREQTCGRKSSVIESYSNGVWRANAQALCGTLAQGVRCDKDKMRVNIQLPQHDAQQSHVPLLYIQSIWARSFQWRTEDLVSPLRNNLLILWSKREIWHVDGTMEQLPPGNVERNSLDHFRGTNP